MPLKAINQNVHLLWRAGFGPELASVRDLDRSPASTLYARLKKASAPAPPYLRVVQGSSDGLWKGIRELGRMEQLSREQKQDLRKQSQEGLRSLNLAWMREMVEGEASLREKMALFWHGHFACRNLNIYFQQELLHIIRQHALGDFATLLREVSRSAAMLAFLNNQQNRKQHPNENFARELMELFTLGRGQYTETDVKEAARAFTGWGFNLEGGFVFRRALHDDGEKKFMGRRGRFSGDDILDILLEDPRTARFIAGKVFRFFVSDTIDPEKQAWLGKRFYASGYRISSLLDDIFLSDWFYEDRYTGSMVKSPIALMVGMQRMLPVQFEKPEVLILYQHLLGQVLFFPPNVAGWPGGNSWIDSSTLMHRLRLPRIWQEDEDIQAVPKADDDQAMGRATSEDLALQRRQGGRKAMLNASIDWGEYVQAFAGVRKEDLPARLATTLLVTGKVDLRQLQPFLDRNSREDYIRSLTISLMSLPEYQVC